MNAAYPHRFVNSVIKEYNEKCNSKTQDCYIILPDFFYIPQPLTLAQILHCSRNVTLSKHFIKKFHELTSNSYKIRIKWITNKMKQLFKLKTRNLHPTCVIYKGVCVHKQPYINKMGRYVELPWKEQDSISKNLKQKKT